MPGKKVVIKGRKGKRKTRSDPSPYKGLSTKQLGEIEDYRDFIRQCYDKFGGNFDLDLIATITYNVVQACNQSWIDKMLGGELYGPNSMCNEPDLDLMEVDELMTYAEQKQLTPGLVHGDRRRAAGIELIRTGLQVLRGEVRSPLGKGRKHLRAFSPTGS